MAEEVRSDLDLAGGEITLHQASLMEIERTKARRRLSLQAIAFGVALLFVCALTYFFVAFIGRVLCLFESGKAASLDWHVLLLGSGLIVPATLILYSVVRWTYSEQPAPKNDEEELPSSGLLKEVVGMLKDVADMVGSLAKKVGSD